MDARTRISNTHTYSLPTTLPHTSTAVPTPPARRSWRNCLNLDLSLLPREQYPHPHHPPPHHQQHGTGRSPYATRTNGSRTGSRIRSRSRSKGRREPRWWKVRLFRGMVLDVRRRAPFYWSDWVDAWDYRVVPATVYMYFAKYGIGFFFFLVGQVRYARF